MVIITEVSGRSPSEVTIRWRATAHHTHTQTHTGAAKCLKQLRGKKTHYGLQSTVALTEEEFQWGRSQKEGDLKGWGAQGVEAKRGRS